MSRPNTLSTRMALIGVLIPSTVAAQVFTAPTNPFPRTPRLTIGAYVALWDFPPTRDVIVSGTQKKVSLTPQFDPGPLVTADYRVTNRLSLGGYWSSLTGTADQSTVIGPSRIGVTVHLQGDLDGNSWDVHAAYYASRTRANSWWLQVGYTKFSPHYRSAIMFVSATELKKLTAGWDSLGLWVNGSREIGSRRFGTQSDPIKLFESIGYYTSPKPNGPWNFVFGGLVPLSHRLNLDASVWVIDVTGRRDTRTSVGLSSSF